MLALRLKSRHAVRQHRPSAEKNRAHPRNLTSAPTAGAGRRPATPEAGKSCSCLFSRSDKLAHRARHVDCRTRRRSSARRRAAMIAFEDHRSLRKPFNRGRPKILQALETASSHRGHWKSRASSSIWSTTRSRSGKLLLLHPFATLRSNCREPLRLPDPRALPRHRRRIP